MCYLNVGLPQTLKKQTFCVVVYTSFITISYGLWKYVVNMKQYVALWVLEVCKISDFLCENIDFYSVLIFKSLILTAACILLLLFSLSKVCFGGLSSILTNHSSWNSTSLSRKMLLLGCMDAKACRHHTHRLVVKTLNPLGCVISVIRWSTAWILSSQWSRQTSNKPKLSL